MSEDSTLGERLADVILEAESSLDDDELEVLAGELVEFAARMYPRDAAAVFLSDERWDDVIHSLEENIDQLHGPTELVETDDGYEVANLMDVSEEQAEAIEALQETLDLIMEQVTDGDN